MGVMSSIQDKADTDRYRNASRQDPFPFSHLPFFWTITQKPYSDAFSQCGDLCSNCLGFAVAVQLERKLEKCGFLGLKFFSYVAFAVVRGKSIPLCITCIVRSPAPSMHCDVLLSPTCHPLCYMRMQLQGVVPCEWKLWLWSRGCKRIAFCTLTYFSQLFPPS